MDPTPTSESYLKFYKEEFWAIKEGRKEDWRGQQQNRGLNHAASYQRQVRIPRVEAMVGRLLRAGDSILEIGCGHGETLSYLTERYRLGGYAVEPSDEAIAYLRENHSTIEVVARSIEELFDNEEFAGKFDLILISHCLENILDVNRALITVRNLLSKSGHLYIDTPNLYWSGGMNPYHPIVFTPETLCAFLGKHGFRVRKINASKRPVGLIRDSLRSRKRWFNLLAVKGTSEIQPRHSDHEEIKHAFEISRRVLALDAQMRRLKKRVSRASRI